MIDVADEQAHRDLYDLIVESLSDMRAERERLWQTLQAQGGRGVELAEAIDELDAKIARAEKAA